MSTINFNNILLDDGVEAWSKKFGYSLYVDIFQTLSVDKLVDGKYVACNFDYSKTSQEKIVELIEQSVKEDKDLIAPYVKETDLPEDAVI